MTPEEKQELLQIAKENGTQAVPTLITIVEDIVSDDESKQELLQIAKENGTQAVPILITIVEDIIPDDESMQELLQIAKENGTQAVPILTEIIEKLPEKNPFTFIFGDEELENGQTLRLPDEVTTSIKLEAKSAALLSNMDACKITKRVGTPSETTTKTVINKSASAPKVVWLTYSATRSVTGLTRFDYVNENDEILFTFEFRLEIPDN